MERFQMQTMHPREESLFLIASRETFTGFI